jgi:hypothetical protein
MNQAQELAKIDRLVKKINPTNPTMQKLVQEWNGWFSKLDWYGKNLSKEKLKHARQFHDIVTAKSSLGAEITKATGNYTTPGSVVPTPEGYRRATQEEITQNVLGFAKAALAHFSETSKKKGEAAAIGQRYSAVIAGEAIFGDESSFAGDGKQYLSQCEWHFDNHPDPKREPYWHMGSSIFVPITPIPRPAAQVALIQKTVAKTLFKTADTSLSSLVTDNPYAGEIEPLT